MNGLLENMDNTVQICGGHRERKAIFLRGQADGPGPLPGTCRSALMNL